MVAEQEDDLLRLAGLKVQLDLMRADGRPAVGDGVSKLAGCNGGRRIPSAITAQEGLALRIEAGQRLGAGEVGKVIAALAVLGLVIDHAVLDFHLAGVEVALKIGGVVLSVPQAELDGGEGGDGGFDRAFIGDGELPDLQVLVERDKVSSARFDAR